VSFRKMMLPKVRDLRKGDLIFRNRSEGCEAPHVVMEVSDTGSPRYGALEGTRLSYRVVNPATGTELNLSEFEIAAEYDIGDP
tara:strand:+ start:232 stop:480 length:249 start_codon:yes stop_codon:yes gene_type:complete